MRLRAEGPVEREPSPESAAVDAALIAWRRKAGDILMAATAAVHLPAAVLIMLGYSPPVSALGKALGVTAYLVMTAAALFRPVQYRTRLWAFFFAAYLVTAVTSLATPHSPYAQVTLVIHPVLVLVLCGAAAVRIAVLASATILVSAPFLRDLPAVVGALGTDPAQLAAQQGAVWLQAAALAAFLAAPMILLDRFNRFLWDALTEQWRAIRERQCLEREVAATGDRERRRLGQELHDGVCQQVTAALLHCQVLGRRLKSGGTLSDGDFQTLSSLLTQTIGDARSVARGLCPLDPDPEALAAALRALAKRTREMLAVQCEITTTGDVRVPDPAMAQHLYRITQEAMSNAARHANATRISIELRANADALLLRVEDDGVSLPAKLPAGGMGLRTMAYRAQILGGELTVTPAPGGGTCVMCRVPRAAGTPALPNHSGEHRWIPTT